MNYPEEIKVKDYFKIHDYYSEIYGYERTIILMQVGSFHEVYCTDFHGLDLIKLAGELDVACPLKNGKKPISKSNPRMLGFPTYVVENFIEKLCNLDYTVVLINQTTKPPNPKREVVGIFSPATFIEKNKKYSASKSTYLTSLVIDKLIKNNNIYFVIGISTYDLSTGKGSFYECYSNQNDELLALDDAIRFLETYPSNEILVYYNDILDNKVKAMKYKDIVSYLGLDNVNIYRFTDLDKKLKKISYQKDILERIFNNDNQFDIIDSLGLSFNNWARLSLIYLLDYVKNHQTILLNKLMKPELFSSNEKLFLGNRTLEQLDVLPSNNKPTSLFNIINFTKTCIGKRFLRNALSRPLVLKEDIDKRLNIIELINKYKLEKIIGDSLENIYDLEKLNRRVDIKKMHPYELYHFYQSYEQVIELVKILKTKKELIKELDLSLEKHEELQDMLDYIDDVFDLNKITNLNFINFKDTDICFFKENICKDIDDNYKNIQSCNKFIDNLVIELEKYIDDKKKKDTNFINIKYNDREGHYLLLTKRRCEKMLNKMKKKKVTKFKIGSFLINLEDLDFHPLPRGTNTKIKCKKIKEISYDLVKYKTLLAELQKEKFYEQLEKISIEYSDIYNYWTNKTALIDFLNSGTFCIKKLGYSKPDIINSNNSYFNTIELRHPIVEFINKDVEYHPHSLGLGNNNKLDGILLYGINSSGKSTLMKSVGLNIILAQIGYYVSAKEFELSPYESLFTRISGNDNIFRGLSSFMVEMVELTAILKRNTSKTLVIGDEICRGTEEKSANILVACMLEELAKTRTTFITATHLHKIANMPSVKKLERVKPMHLKVDYDVETETLIYSRELQEGQGESFYGVNVAKFVMKDKDFNKRISELIEEYDDYQIKSSKYNSDNWLVECYLCQSKDNLETHHINWQKDCKDKRVINKKHIGMNDNSNLITLCSSCHDKVDCGEIEIDGFIMTSKGKKLKHKKGNKNKKRKFNTEQIMKIKEYKDLEISIKQAKRKIKKDLLIKVSTSTIEKIWKNQY